MEVLQAQLGNQATHVYDGILNLNVTKNELQMAIQDMFVTRDRLLGLFGVPQVSTPRLGRFAKGAMGRGAPAGKKKKKSPQSQSQSMGMGMGMGMDGARNPSKRSDMTPNQRTLKRRESRKRKEGGLPGTPDSGGFATNLNSVPPQGTGAEYKSKLQILVAQRAGRNLTKGEIVYETVEHEGGYIAGVHSELLSAQYAGDSGSTSKKVAEQEAAKAALLGEFPEEYQAIIEGQPVGGKGGGLGAPGGGIKRPHGAMSGGGGGGGVPSALNDPHADGKRKLVEALQMLLQRTLQKGDMEFNTANVQPGVRDSPYQSVLKLPSLDPSAMWTAQSDNKKSAENMASDLAMAALHDQIAVATEEHQVRKKAKDEARRAKLEAEGKPIPARLTGQLS